MSILVVVSSRPVVHEFFQQVLCSNTIIRVTSGSIRGGPIAKRMSTYLYESLLTTIDMEILNGENEFVFFVDLRNDLRVTVISRS